jgi:DNA polymerase-3 subunit delta
MKILPKQIREFINAKSHPIRVALFFGPEEGLIAERSSQLAQNICPDLKDAFCYTELTNQDVSDSPSLLFDEMASQSLMGTDKLIRIKGATDKAFAALTSFLDADLETNNFLIIEAGDLDKRSKLRNLSEKSPKIASIACYEEDASQLIPQIKEMLAAYNMEADHDALLFMATHLAHNRLMLKSEIQKLISYKGDDKKIILDDLKEIISSHSNLFLDEACWTAADGSYVETDKALTQLMDQSIAPVSVLRAAQNHFNKLLYVKMQILAGTSLDKALFSLRPPLFFKVKNKFIQQVQRWNISDLQEVLNLLQHTEQECKKTNTNAPLALSRLFYKICAISNKKNKTEKSA